MFVINVVYQTQVSSVTDHVGSQDTAAKSADFDDDEGGLVSLHLYETSNIVSTRVIEICIPPYNNFI